MEKHYYVSWVDKRTDPWPQWEKLPPADGEVSLQGRKIVFLPQDNPLWSGVPFLLDHDPQVVADARMGQFPWPGIPFALVPQTDLGLDTLMVPFSKSTSNPCGKFRAATAVLSCEFR